MNVGDLKAFLKDIPDDVLIGAINDGDFISARGGASFCEGAILRREEPYDPKNRWKKIKYIRLPEVTYPPESGIGLD